MAGAWSPLRIAAFRALWLAQLASMIGTWMQTVGAQWLLIDEPNAPALVSLVQTASFLPILLLALPAGVLADSLDRRRLLVVVQVGNVAVGAALTTATALGDIPPHVLLGATFLLGCGQALSMPAWQARIPDIVPRDQVRAAVALGAVGVNVARAVGPGVAGLLITRLEVAAVFAVNTASYAVLITVLVLVRAEPPGRGPVSTPERFLPALRAGARYVRHSRVLRRMLLRSALFVLPGSALWALLPIVATRRLGLAAGGYGLLLAALGLGAVVGAVVLPRVTARTSVTPMVLAASVVFAAAQVGVVLVDGVLPAVLLLLPAGAAWLAVLSSIGAAAQIFLPAWVRARGLSVTQTVFIGGQALGALAWGFLANAAGTTTALLVASGVMLLGAATVAAWPLHDVSPLDRGTAVYWPEPPAIEHSERDEGPVLVTVTFTVAPESIEPFLVAMRRVQGVRRRTGATRWKLYRDAADPLRFVETFLVPSWGEHLRQHYERLTGTDRDIENEAHALATQRPEVTHLISAHR